MKSKILIATTVALTATITSAVWAFAASDIKLFVNGKQSTADVQIIDGSSYVPLRAVAELLGANVTWNEDKREIGITSKKLDLPKEGTYQAGDLAFSDVQVSQSTYGWTVTAEVSNTSAKTIRGANFTVSFYDDSGKRVGTASGSTNNLEPSGTKTEKLITSDNLTGWKTMKFQIDISY